MARKKKKEGRGKKTEGKRKTGRRWESALSEIRQDLLCHVAVRQQPVWSESGAASLDIPQAVTLTQTDPGGGTGDLTCTTTPLELYLKNQLCTDREAETQWIMNFCRHKPCV